MAKLSKTSTEYRVHYIETYALHIIIGVETMRAIFCVVVVVAAVAQYVFVVWSQKPYNAQRAHTLNITGKNWFHIFAR